MTREEAIRFGKTILMFTNKELESDKHTYEFTTMAIKALENQPKFIIHSDGTIKQIIEPCEDCISREDVYELIEDINDTVFGQQVSKGVANLPSVQPMRPKGEWIGNENGRCSVCGHEGCGSDIWDGCKDGMYCPNCGADMRGTK